MSKAISSKLTTWLSISVTVVCDELFLTCGNTRLLHLFGLFLLPFLFPLVSLYLCFLSPLLLLLLFFIIFSAPCFFGGCFRFFRFWRHRITNEKQGFGLLSERWMFPGN